MYIHIYIYIADKVKLLKTLGNGLSAVAYTITRTAFAFERIFWCTHNLHFSLKSYSATSCPGCRTLLPTDSGKYNYYIRIVIYSSASAKIKAVSYRWSSILIGQTIFPTSGYNRLTNQRRQTIVPHWWEKRIDFSRHSSCEPLQFELFVSSQISFLLRCVHTYFVVKHANF